MVKVGDSVKVNPGIRDVDFDIDIGGWQGRVIEIISEGETLALHWDSVTLREMLSDMIEDCIDQGLGWTEYYIKADEVTPASPRDTEADVDQVVDELEKEHAWGWVGPAKDAIREALAGVDPDDQRACMQAWGKHLKENLSFPFEAEVDELRMRGPLQAGDRVLVRRFVATDAHKGAIVRVKHGRRQYNFSLCDLEALESGSPNRKMIHAYRVWYDNR